MSLTFDQQWDLLCELCIAHNDSDHAKVQAIAERSFNDLTTDHIEVVISAIPIIDKGELTDSYISYAQKMLAKLQDVGAKSFSTSFRAAVIDALVNEQQ